jgi:hypothetical protein
MLDTLMGRKSVRLREAKKVKVGDRLYLTPTLGGGTHVVSEISYDGKGEPPFFKLNEEWYTYLLCQIPWE